MTQQTKQGDAYVQLARQTIDEYVRTGRQIPVPSGLLQEMYETCAGVFVSIKIKDRTSQEKSARLRLRGCIGTIQAVQPSIAQELIHNAISAASRDPRFSPITPQELADLTISVDVLGAMEPIQSARELDVKRYGVVVTNGYRRGLLLPNLDGVNTVQEQLAIAKQKAGIGEDEPVQLERFEVVRHI